MAPPSLKPIESQDHGIVWVEDLQNVTSGEAKAQRAQQNPGMPLRDGVCPLVKGQLSPSRVLALVCIPPSLPLPTWASLPSLFKTIFSKHVPHDLFI